MGLILLIILVVLLILLIPAWPYNRTWGFAPTGLIGIILAIVLLLVIFKVINLWDIKVTKENGKTTIEVEEKDMDQLYTP